MKRSDTRLVFPFKASYNNDQWIKLTKILSENKADDNLMLLYTCKLLSFIDSGDILYSNEMRNRVLRVLSDALEIEMGITTVIFDLIFNEELVEIDDGNVKLTWRGRLFYVSDGIISTMDIIRYFWERADWSNIFGEKTTSKFTQVEARRYIANLLLNIDKSIEWGKNLKNKFQNIDPIYLSNYYNILDMLNDKQIRCVFEYIFQPLGLISVNNDNELKITITETGKGIFQYYSYDIIEEYKALLEDSWENYDKGNFEQAYDIVKNVFSVTWDIPEAYNLVGCIYIKLKEYEKARDTFLFGIEICEEKVGKIDSLKTRSMDSYVMIYYNLGLCYYYMGEMFKALSIFTMLKKTIPYSIENLEAALSTIKKIIIIQN